MRLSKSLLRATAIVLIMIFLVTSPVLAIGNPTSIAFYCVGSTPIYKVFYNVLETGDMLFTAEQYVHYAVTPTDYTAGEAFLFEVLDVAGTATLASTPLKQYEAKPISIYMTVAQVTAAGISVNDALTIRITGNPLIFASPVGNTVTAVLAASDYVDQELGDDGGVATDNNLRNFLIGVAEDLEANDSPPVGSEYIITVSGVQYLTTIGGSIFIEGIPGLDGICPILFQYSSAPMTGDEPESTGAYVSSLSPLQQWGQTAANGLTNLGIYLGISQALAGNAMLLAMFMGLGVYAYSRTQSGMVVLLLVGTMPFIGAFFGLMSLALAFVFVIIIVLFLGFFFYSRGVL